MATHKNTLSKELLEKFNYYYFELGYSREQTRKLLNLSFHHFNQLKKLSGRYKVKPRTFLKDILTNHSKEEIISYFNDHSFEDTVRNFGMTDDILYTLLKQENVCHSSRQKVNFRKNTCKKLYGVEHIFQRPDIREKCESPASIKKMCQTQIKNNLEKFGVKYTPQRQDVKEKIKETNFKKYGGGSWASSEEGRKRMSEIHLSKELQDKTNRTKKLNHSFNSSLIEKQYKEKLISVYGENDVKYQYRDPRYPYTCDFYIKSQDLFIELNAHWTHGKHPFNKDDLEDIKKLEQWRVKAETSNFYKQAIQTWTIRDVDKIKKLNDNRLNYILVYSDVIVINGNSFCIKFPIAITDNMRKQFLDLPIKSITEDSSKKLN